MIKPMNIIDGWKNLFLNLNEELAEERAQHCTSCEFAKMGSWNKIIKDEHLVQIQGLTCGKCGCPLSAKLRSKKEVCPIKKW